MIIEAKGTQTEPKPVPSASRYLLKSMDRQSHGPKVVLLFLVGLVLYLKSMLPVWLTEPRAEKFEPVDDRTPAGEAEEPMEEIEPLAAAKRAEEPDDAVTTGSVLPKGTVGSASAQIIELFGGSAPMPPAVSLSDFLTPEKPLAWRDPSLPFVPVDSANDNRRSGGAPTGGGIPEIDDNDGPPPRVVDEEDDDDDDDSTNRAPRVTGPVYLMDITGCIALAISLSDLLRNASDPDGDTLAIRNLQVSSGSLAVSPGGGWVFQAAAQMEGLVTITYQVTDGALSVTQRAIFKVVPENVVIGTDADDRILGSVCRDMIDGRDGNDNIDARSGDDTIFGGAGDDHIVAGEGHDTVFAGLGHDIVFGGAGNDRLSGGDGNDRMFGEEGDDILFGDAGDDVLSGGAGEDIVMGGEGNDIARGDAGNDRIDGGAGDDELHGDAGDDVLLGGEGCDVIHDGAGMDVVQAGAGDDRVVAALDAVADVYDGGEGSDTLDYSAAIEDVFIDLVNGTACGIEIGEDTISGFEAAIGGAGDDHFLAGGQAPALLEGGLGRNIFEFAQEPVAAVAVFEIADFKAGDRVKMKKYDIFEKVFDEFENEFAKIYGDHVDEDDVRIRYRNEYNETAATDHTVIEADFDRDDTYETTILLNGRYALVIVEAIA